MLTVLCPDLRSHAGFRQDLTLWPQAHGSTAIPSADLTHAQIWGGKGRAQAGSACQESDSVGCPQKALVDRDPVGREKNSQNS